MGHIINDFQCLERERLRDTFYSTLTIRRARTDSDNKPYVTLLVKEMSKNLK
jgi:hypothetical protein